MLRLLARRLSSSAANAVKVEHSSNNVTTLTLDLAETRNSLSATVCQQLLREIDTLPTTTRVLVLESTGTVFSSGHNLKELRTADTETRHSIFTTTAEVCSRLQEIPLPTIAHVRGLAAAAGCQLVASCDLVVASEDSQFSTPGVRFGLFCSTPSVPLIRSVPRKVAMRMLLTGDPITAQEAYVFGLISHIAKPGDSKKTLDKLLERLLSLSGDVLALGKRTVIAHDSEADEKARCIASEAMLVNLGMEDCVEGLNAFVEKRHPKYK